MLVDNSGWPYGDHPELAVLRAKLSTKFLLDGYRNTTFITVLEWSEAGSFTGGAAGNQNVFFSSLQHNFSNFSPT
jgi:hypothetical protein